VTDEHHRKRKGKIRVLGFDSLQRTDELASAALIEIHLQGVFSRKEAERLD
jgi:hypothetical protein